MATQESAASPEAVGNGEVGSNGTVAAVADGDQAAVQTAADAAGDVPAAAPPPNAWSVIKGVLFRVLPLTAPLAPPGGGSGELPLTSLRVLPLTGPLAPPGGCSGELPLTSLRVLPLPSLGCSP
ncbi:unnamed protein product [Boreogadus saida]